MENRLLRCRRSCLVLVEMQKPPPTIHPGFFFPSPPNISSSEGLSNVLLSLFKCAILVFHLKFFAPATCYYTESKWWWCLVYNPPLFFSTCLMYRRFTYRRRKKNFGFIVHPLVSHSIRWVFCFFFLRVFCTCVKKTWNTFNHRSKVHTGSAVGVFIIFPPYEIYSIVICALQ